MIHGESQIIIPYAAELQIRRNGGQQSYYTIFEILR